MKSDNGNTKPNNGGNPSHNYTAKGSNKIRHLIFYLFYVGLILAVGIRLGVFRGRSLPPLNASLNSRPVSGFGISETPDQIIPLPPGILTFDGELKQSTVHEGDTEAKFIFNLTNVSRQSVIIEQVKTSCGCTVAQLPQMPWTLAPHTKGQIPVTMNVLGHTGKDSKTITIITSQGSKILNVEANILPTPENDKMGDRERNLELAKVDRQAVFRGDCANCHAEPTKGKMGQELYVVACGICHEANPRSTMVPNLHVLNHPTDYNYWMTMIALGKHGSLMPAFAKGQGGPLTVEQIDSLAKTMVEAFPSEVPPLKN